MPFLGEEEQAAVKVWHIPERLCAVPQQCAIYIMGSRCRRHDKSQRNQAPELIDALLSLPKVATVGCKRMMCDSVYFQQRSTFLLVQIMTPGNSVWLSGVAVGPIAEAITRETGRLLVRPGGFCFFGGCV